MELYRLTVYAVLAAILAAVAMVWILYAKDKRRYEERIDSEKGRSSARHDGDIDLDPGAYYGRN